MIKNLLLVALGLLAGSLSGYSLIAQVTSYQSQSSTSRILYLLIRLVSFGLLGWYLLRWGALGFILCGGTMFITMWIIIFTFNY